MREILKINCDGIDLQMQILDYQNNNEDDDNWTQDNITVKSKQWLNYEISGEVLLSSDVDYLCYELQQLIDNKLEEPTEIGFPEPDLSFVLHPIHDIRDSEKIVYVAPDHRLVDIYVDLEIHFWDEGGLTANKLCITLSRDEIKALLTYLLLITHKLNEDNQDLQELKKKDIICSCY